MSTFCPCIFCIVPTFLQSDGEDKSSVKSIKFPAGFFSSGNSVRRYKQYTEDTLQLALKEIMEGQSINRLTTFTYASYLVETITKKPCGLVQSSEQLQMSDDDDDRNFNPRAILYVKIQ